MADARLSAVVNAPAWNRTTGVLATPFQFTVDGADSFRLVSACSTTGVIVTLAYRMRREDGSIEYGTRTHTPNTDRSVKTETFSLGAGALLDAVLYASSGAPKFGECYVMLQLLRGFSGATVLMGEILADYITARQGVAFPGSPIRSSLDGQGVLKTIVGPVPAASVEVNVPVPTGARWKVIAVRLNFQTDATAITRTPHLQLHNGAATCWFHGAEFTQVGASVNATYFYNIGDVDIFNAALRICSSNMPDELVLLAGGAVQTFTENIQGGDQYIVVNTIVREWLEVA